MSRRIAVFTAALAMTAGLGVIGSAAAQARSAPTVTVAINHASFVATQTGVLSIHLGGPGGEQKVAVTRILANGARQAAGTVTTDSHGNATAKLPMVYSAHYAASWAGNAAWLPGSRSTGLVHVAAYTDTHLAGSYGAKGHYHLIHAGKHGELDIFVYPNKAGQKVNFPLQSYYRGAWHTKANKSYKLKAGSYDGVRYSITGTTFRASKGYRSRIRAEYHGDKVNTGRVSGWYYIMFV